VVSPTRPVSAGARRNPREAATSPCRRPRTAGRGVSPAARPVPFCRPCFLPPPLTLAAGLRGVPALPGPRLREPYSGACRVVPFYCRRWPAVPGVEIALSMLAHFSAARKKVARRLSRVTLRPGTGRSKMCIKQLYVLTVRGQYIN
jgi:hypothetical protein